VTLVWTPGLPTPTVPPRPLPNLLEASQTTHQQTDLGASLHVKACVCSRTPGQIGEPRHLVKACVSSRTPGPIGEPRRIVKACACSRTPGPIGLSATVTRARSCSTQPPTSTTTRSTTTTRSSSLGGTTSSTMRPIATHVAWSGCFPVCLLATSAAETVEPIVVPYAGCGLGWGPRNHCALVGGGHYVVYDAAYCYRLAWSVGHERCKNGRTDRWRDVDSGGGPRKHRALVGEGTLCRLRCGLLLPMQRGLSVC